MQEGLVLPACESLLLLMVGLFLLEHSKTKEEGDEKRSQLFDDDVFGSLVAEPFNVELALGRALVLLAPLRLLFYFFQ